MSKVLGGSGYANSEVKNTKLGVNKSVDGIELCICVLGFYCVALIVEWSVLFSHTAGTKCLTV